MVPDDDDFERDLFAVFVFVVFRFLVEDEEPVVDFFRLVFVEREDTVLVFFVLFATAMVG